MRRENNCKSGGQQMVQSQILHKHLQMVMFLHFEYKLHLKTWLLGLWLPLLRHQHSFLPKLRYELSFDTCNDFKNVGLGEQDLYHIYTSCNSHRLHMDLMIASCLQTFTVRTHSSYPWLDLSLLIILLIMDIYVLCFVWQMFLLYLQIYCHTTLNHHTNHRVIK